ncbi:YggS family pyridoxal phosphate-dependent enzyme [Fredinandcohnia sp. QZ13]|uniref:YggS family pyridoxal phosphate-dependent enzyme n=1 Tax=Fredinandcohnia sp. QZ13 TaxID=3073144 RepID=UPI00285306A3|nr:YggS family pyridoxal phosphate-dependent enzyme [Fredinandcohnia sp. QZ13]MDR4886576.1 YggS family pyridoxal phosphate-dependent enzyme [Fredinandcohnia sp. QZ13]
MSVKENLLNIQEKIEQACMRSNRSADDVSIIAVTKYVSVETAKEAIEAGVRHIGENRDDGLIKKLEEIGDEPTWHFIGSLQTRKVKNIIDKVDYIHSLDRITLAEEIHKRASGKIKCFVQVNVSGEESKHGITPEQLESFIKELEKFPSIEIVGLMTMAPFIEDKNIIRECFKRLRKLRDDVQAQGFSYAPCTELSMGMSNDYDIAIEEGATFIRIGTSLVGKEF